MSWCYEGPQTEWLVNVKQAFAPALQADESTVREAADLLSGQGRCLPHDGHLSTHLPVLEGAELLSAVCDIRTLIPCVSWSLPEGPTPSSIS